MSDKKINFGAKRDIEVSIFVDISDPEVLKVLSDEEEKNLPDPLPEHIIKINSSWKRPTFLIQQIIEANSISEKIINGQKQRFFDPGSNVVAQIRVLLKKTNLHEFDPNFTLEFEKSIDNPKIEVLTLATMQKLGEISPPEILNRLVNKMLISDFLVKTPKETLKP